MKLFTTWKNIIMDPMNFYEKLPKKIEYKKPSLFFVKLHALMLGVMILLFILFGSFFLSLMGVLGEEIAALGGLTFLFIIIGIVIGVPVFLLFGWGMLFVQAGITHLFVLLFGGEQGYKETFKVVAYATAPNIAAFIPFLNWAASIYNIVLQVIGIHKRQKLSIGKSVAVVLLPMVIVFLLVMPFIIFAWFAALMGSL